MQSLLTVQYCTLLLWHRAHGAYSALPAHYPTGGSVHVARTHSIFRQGPQCSARCPGSPSLPLSPPVRASTAPPSKTCAFTKVPHVHYDDTHLCRTMVARPKLQYPQRITNIPKSFPTTLLFSVCCKLCDRFRTFDTRVKVFHIADCTPTCLDR